MFGRECARVRAGICWRGLKRRCGLRRRPPGAEPKLAGMRKMAQRRTRKPKKSETLEVRLDHETKQDFIERCRENGTTASDVVRSAIDRYLAKHKKPAWRPTPEANDGVSAMILPFVKQRKRFLAGGVGAVTLAAMVAMPSAAKPTSRSRSSR